MEYLWGIVKILQRKVLSETLYSCIRHVTQTKQRTEQYFPLSSPDSTSWSEQAVPSFLPELSPYSLSLSIPLSIDISPSLSSEIFISDSCHSTSHHTFFTENIAVAIFKFPQMKSMNDVCLKMPKNSVYKLKSLLKLRSEIVFFPGYPLGLAQ